MIKRFFSYYKPYKFTFCFDLFCAFSTSVIGMLYPIITRMMLNDFIPNREYVKIVKFGLLLLLAYVIKMLMKYFMDYYGHVVGTNMQADMRRDLFQKLEKLPFSYYDNNETGKIMSRMSNDLFEVSELAHHGPENFFLSVVMFLFAFIYLSSISLRLTLIIFAFAPILFIVVSKTRKRHMEAKRLERSAQSIINGNLNSSISGIRVTKAFNNEESEIKKFEEGNKAFVDSKYKQYRSMAFLHSTTNFFTDLFNVVCLLAGGIFLYRGEISFGDYSTFIVSINLFVQPILTFINFLEQFQEGISGFERFLEIIDLPIEEDDEDAIDYCSLNGDIEFKNVSFSYTAYADKEVLDNVSFKIKKGETVALVGPSGGGKTTICHLLLRFYKNEVGSIIIDNHDIRKITMKSLRDNIGIVQQDVFLFAGSIYDNILYGKKDATYEEVMEAAKKANIYEYASSLPNGFDTEIGERGVKLSGGQKQRLSIARVFLKNPSILILDEATSALDNSTEVLIQNALDKLKEGRTTLVVAHRLSTIKNANKILVVCNGSIEEEGSHEQLIQVENGIYKKLYEAQFKSLDVDNSLMMS